MNAIGGINLLLNKYAEKHKEKLGPGEKIIGIFNNCTMIFCLKEDDVITTKSALTVRTTRTLRLANTSKTKTLLRSCITENGK